MEQIINPKSTALLKGLSGKDGHPLNIFRDMAASPLPIRMYNQSQNLVYSNATLSGPEINIVQLAVSVENACIFCVPAHTASAINRDKISHEIIEAIRQEQPVPDPRFNALINLAKRMVKGRGDISDSVLNNFFEQGYTQEQLFEVLCIVSYKTLTNYTSVLMGTQPNSEHKEYEWKKNRSE